MDFTWQITGVNNAEATMVVEFTNTDGVVKTFNLPQAPKGAVVAEWITSYSPFKEIVLSDFERVVVGLSGVNVPAPTPAPTPA